MVIPRYELSRLLNVPHNRAVQSLVSDFVDWAQEVISTKDFLRKDYYEMVALPLLLLGRVPPDLHITIRAPGSISIARWMQRFICSMKVVLFASQLIEKRIMTQGDIEKHAQLVLFIIIFYVRFWTEAPLITLAASNDLSLFKALMKFKYSPMTEMKNAMLNKLSHHLWYLSEELCFFSLFCPSVSNALKDKSAQAMKKYQCNLKVGKLITPSTITSTVSLPDLFGPRSYLLANLVGESTTFLGNSACTWDNNESYCRLKSILSNIPAVNDAAERAILLAKTLHNKLTDSDNQKSNLYINVPHTRKLLGKRRKSDVMSAEI